MTLKNFPRSACCKLKHKQFSGPSETAHSVQTRERGGGRPLKTSSGSCSKLSECAASSLDSRKSALNHSGLIRFLPSRSVGFASPDSAQSKMAACWLMVPSQTQCSAEQRSAAGGSEDRGGCTSSLAGAALFVVAGVITKEKNVPVAQKPGKITYCSTMVGSTIPVTVVTMNM